MEKRTLLVNGLPECRRNGNENDAPPVLAAKNCSGNQVVPSLTHGNPLLSYKSGKAHTGRYVIPYPLFFFNLRVSRFAVKEIMREQKKRFNSTKL